MKIICPKCTARFNVPDSSVGKKAKCSNCDKIFRIDPPKKPPADVTAIWKKCPGPFDLRQSFIIAIAVGQSGKNLEEARIGSANKLGVAMIHDLVITALNGQHPGEGIQTERLFFDGAQVSVIASTRESIAGASAEDTQQFIETYIKSPLAGSRSVQGLQNIQGVDLGSKYADWQNYIDTIKVRHKGLAAEGKDAFSQADSIEPYIMALEDMMGTLREMYFRSYSYPERRRPVVEQMSRVKLQLDRLKTPGAGFFDGWAEKATRETYQQVDDVMGQFNQTTPTPVHLHYHSDTVNNFDQNNVETQRFSQDEF